MKISEAAHSKQEKSHEVETVGAAAGGPLGRFAVCSKCGGRVCMVSDVIQWKLRGPVYFLKSHFILNVFFHLIETGR